MLLKHEGLFCSHIAILVAMDRSMKLLEPCGGSFPCFAFDVINDGVMAGLENQLKAKKSKVDMVTNHEGT